MAGERWRELGGSEGVFELEKKLPSGWCFRSLAVRLDGGGLAVMSPIRGTAGALEAIGRAEMAFAPNHFHYLGVPELGDVPICASATAGPRLAKKLGRAIGGLDVLRERLPEGVTILEPPGLKTGEVWLRAETDRGVAWAVTDAFFNVNDPVRGGTGLVLKLTSTVPGLRIGNTFRWMAVGDERAYREWLEAQLSDDPPRVLIPAHGDVVEGDDLADRLRALTARL